MLAHGFCDLYFVKYLRYSEGFKVADVAEGMPLPNGARWLYAYRGLGCGAARASCPALPSRTDASAVDSWLRLRLVPVLSRYDPRKPKSAVVAKDSCMWAGVPWTAIKLLKPRASCGHSWTARCPRPR